VATVLSEAVGVAMLVWGLRAVLFARGGTAPAA